MKNFFDWEYNYESLHEKDDKCLQNTDHTTGHAFQHGHEDPFNANVCQLILNQNEERMIHCGDEDNYLDDFQNEAQDLDYVQEDQEKQIKRQSLETNKQEFQEKEELKNIKIEEILTFSQVKEPTEILKEEQIQVQKVPDYKLSRKWKQKMKNVLQEKSIHQFSAKHNRNMAKFFVRLFSKYIKLSSQNLNQEFSAEVQYKLQDILEKNCISLKDLESLFGQTGSKASRQFLSKILRTKLKQEVIKSHDVQNKAAYLLCSKVYALRCRSRHLIGRLQSR